MFMREDAEGAPHNADTPAGPKLSAVERGRMMSESQFRLFRGLACKRESQRSECFAEEDGNASEGHVLGSLV
jgi:hypothetical protein